MKEYLRKVLSPAAWQWLQKTKRLIRLTPQHFAHTLGYNIIRKKDYYSPLPLVSELEKNVDRWYKPSSLAGIDYDVAEFKELFSELINEFYAEYAALPPYEEVITKGFGPGYTNLDALVLYTMIRRLKPRRYIEIGSGVSTYYCSLAAAENEKENAPLAINCIEPYPYEKLNSIKNIKINQKLAQDVEPEFFEQLEDGDVLFIDSSHVVKIDSDVSYLFLEILPRLKKGVWIHIHDIPFPYNIPYPAEQWIFQPTWSQFWNEAMLLQAFLSFNDKFKIKMSTPLIRHFDEDFLRQKVPNYKSVEEQPNTFSSIWLRRVA